ncbi:MAG TPA: hypothetical protein VIT90_18680 [Lysobacter sp.]
MPDRADIRWFKSRFAPRIDSAVAGTPFSLDFMVALACQETGEIWPQLRRQGLGEADVLRLCVGDTIDARPDGRGRRAFPRDKAQLLAVEGGAAMFAMAHQVLVDMAEHIPGYRGAARQSHKFCRGFGLFQRDLQFFREDAPYFLQQRYAQFDSTLAHALRELRSKQRRIGLGDRTALSILEQVAVAIAYNTGGYDPQRGTRQGYRPPGGKFYGEAVLDFLRLSETVAVAGEAPLIDPPRRGEAIVPPPSPVAATGRAMRVDTRVSTLFLRSQPRKSRPLRANVIGELPDGHRVRCINGIAVNGYMAVETSLSGALMRGFAATRYLRAESDGGDTAVAAADVAAADAAPTSAGATLPQATMPRRRGQVTRRTGPAGAHSLNEDGQPRRRGADVDTLRAELAAIIDWLGVDKATHGRYQPRDGLTFCNIYCHDFCHLAGAYLPRVWWSTPALLALQRGEAVEALIGDTLREMRANDLFRWLRDFGEMFGWRRTGTLTKLQLAANQGALALVVARRRDDGRSGHIVMVVPERDEHVARRDGAGEVTSPLQSQAGVTNFRYGNAQPGWWSRETFAENAFWIHP